MAYNDDRLANYVGVDERIVKFYERHPDGRIAPTPPELVTVDDRIFIAVTAFVYRTPDDPRPCIGSAWEPYPGKTPYTKDSEAMNAETSAVGRALALAGIEVRRSIASSDEVRARQEDAPEHENANRVRELFADVKKLTSDEQTELRAWANGRKITGPELLGDETWLIHVETKVAETLGLRPAKATS